MKTVEKEFETAKITANIRFIDGNGVMRKFNENHIIAIALQDPKNKDKVWRMGTSKTDKDEIFNPDKK